MARKRTIVGLGELVLRETPEHSEPSGLAAMVTMQAARLGLHGVPISRLGQDDAAGELLARLGEAGVETSHVQSDPDLPTARAIVRPLGDELDRFLEERVAFDNLQWDFDLEDVAQEADVVVYGMVTRRSAQTSSESNRFLAACTAAMKVFDLTHRAGAKPDRGHALSGLGAADVAIVDVDALGCVLPAIPRDDPNVVLDRLMREHGLSLVILVDGDQDQQRLSLRTTDSQASGALPAGRTALCNGIIALMAALLCGKSLQDAASRAFELARTQHESPDAPVPADWLG